MDNIGALTYVNPDDLKVGDEVGVIYPCTYGFGLRFRYPQIAKAKVERITPKRTKFVIGSVSFGELDVRRRIVKIDDNATNMDKVARDFILANRLLDTMDSLERKGKFHLSEMSNEDIYLFKSFLMSMAKRYFSKDDYERIVGIYASKEEVSETGK